VSRYDKLFRRAAQFMVPGAENEDPARLPASLLARTFPEFFEARKRKEFVDAKFRLR